MKISRTCTFRYMYCFLFFLGWVLLQSCRTVKDYYNLPTYGANNGITAVIEIPAGTNKKFEYDPVIKKMARDLENGIPRTINFLPYPGNYGFIPSTLSELRNGGDGDALDILVIAEAIPAGAVVETLPIAILNLIDDGEKDSKVIAVPISKKLQIIDALSYQDILERYPQIPKIIELWFLNYNQNDISEVEGWGDENEALKEIQNHLKN